MNVPLEPTEEAVIEVMSNLEHFEMWCTKNDIAVSALGRTALQDQAALYRWRAKGIRGVSEPKRRALAIYILKNPKGIPGYTRSRTGKKRSVRFLPGGRVPSSSREGKIQEGGGASTTLPVPAPHLLEPDNFSWVRNRAFRRQVAIAVVLGEMVELGIHHTREAERQAEEALNQIGGSAAK